STRLNALLPAAAQIASTAAAQTSGPMPSPGTTAISYVFDTSRSFGRQEGKAPHPAGPVARSVHRRLEVGLADHLAVAVVFLAAERLELLGAHHLDGAAELQDALPEGRVFQRRRQGGVELVDDRPRRAAGRVE